jgi:putative hydrolase of the HAD superfamily
MLPKSQSVLVLDLDDTLYKEADYVLSGLTFIIERIEEIKKCSIRKDVLQFKQHEPNGDVLEYICEVSGLPVSAKESLLWLYRLHTPTISLQSEVSEWVNECKDLYHAIAILTDGRSITQRLKARALDLQDIPIFISEDWGSEKPDPKRFIAIQELWKDKQYIYVGDNCAKDFLAPNSLEWITIGLIDNRASNIHSQSSKNKISIEKNVDSNPHFWINELMEVNNLIAELQLKGNK